MYIGNRIFMKLTQYKNMSSSKLSTGLGLS